MHAYADDTQLYLAFKPSDYANETAVVSSIQSCIRDVQNWMLMDELKLKNLARLPRSWEPSQRPPSHIIKTSKILQRS